MTSKGRNWKLERASVHIKGSSRPRSNKYSKSDADKRPAPHTRSKVWVGGYTRANGRRVEGHFRFIKKRPTAARDELKVYEL